MTALELYKKHIFHSRRNLSSSDVRDVCERILSSDQIDLNVKAATYSVYLYKSIEISCEISNVLDFRSDILASLGEKLASDNFSSLEKSGVREDPFQLFISVLTSGWHYGLFFLADKSDVVSDVIGRMDVVYKYGHLKPSYSLNIFSTFLMVSYFLFKKGRFDEQLLIANRALDIFVRTVSKMQNQEDVASSHIGDLNKAILCMEAIQAGREWVDGVRFREDRWEADYVVRVMSRIRIKEYPLVKNVLIKAIS